MNDQEKQKQRDSQANLIAGAGVVLAVVIALVGVIQMVEGRQTEGAPPILWFAIALAVGVAARVLSQRSR